MLVATVSGVDGIAAAQACPEGNGARGGNVTKCAGPPAALTAPVENITTAQADAASTTTRGRRSARPSRLRRRQPECLISTDSGVIRALIFSLQKSLRWRINVVE